jgi:Domain of unknown function (DUF6089)
MRASIIFLLFLGSVYKVQAQVEIGIFAGIANYNGDLVDKLFEAPKGAVEFSLGYQISSHFAIRGELAFAKVAGADSLSEHAHLRQRNLSFQSPIDEASLQLEYAVFDLDQKRWTPYIFGGFGLFVFNPYTFDKQHNKYFLQKLSTEGEGILNYPRPYSRLQIAIPFGGGVKYLLNDNLLLGLEIGLRKTSTDYLDDVSGNYADQTDLLRVRGPKAVELAYRGGEVPGGDPNYPVKGYPRGSSKYKDYYYFTGLRLTYIFPQKNHQGFSRQGKGHIIGCPSVPL